VGVTGYGRRKRRIGLAWQISLLPDEDYKKKCGIPHFHHLADRI
jgi:hypothetical protein